MITHGAQALRQREDLVTVAPEAAQEVHRLRQRIFPPEQLGIDLGEFLQLLLQLPVMSDTGLGMLLLGLGLKEELGNFAHGQTLGQVVERSVLITPVVAAAVLFAANRESLDKRSPEQVGVDFELGDKEVLALTQGEGGLAAQTEYPSHI